jgi:NAD(P)-dependent dehydrogenase (short-subunit alcohol dehydrogenase family)
MTRSSSLATNCLLAAGAVAVGAKLTAALVRKRRRFEPRGRVVIVTGGSRGLGLEVSRQLVDHGAKLVICARDEAELREAADELTGRGGDVLTVVCDVTSDDDVERLVQQTVDHFGRVDALINNAAIISVGPASAMTRDDYEHALDVDFRGPLRTMLAVMPHFRKQGTGRIVNVASIGGLVPIPHLAPYTAAKHALVGLGTSLRGDLLRENIVLSTICPGLISTGSPKHALYKGDREAEYEWFAGSDNSPLAASPVKIAAAVVRGLIDGDALIVSPPSFKLSASLHGLMPGVSTELSGLIAKLLPGPHRTNAAKPGHQLAADLPASLEHRQHAAAASYNE